MAVGEGERVDSAVEAERRGEQLRRLAAAALLINSTVELDELLAVITAQARETVGAHQAFISYAPPTGGYSFTSSSLSEKYAAWQEEAPLEGTPLEGLVGEGRHSHRLTHAEVEAYLAEVPGADHGTAAGRPPLRGWLAAALAGRAGERLGLLQLSDKDEGEFTAEDEAILVQFAQMASAAIANARLYGEVRRHADELDALFALADAVALAGSLDEVFTVALDALEQAIGVQRGSVVLFDRSGGIHFHAWRGLSDEYRRRIEGRSPWKGHVDDPAPFVVADVLADPDVAELQEAFRDEGIRSMALVPLVQAGVILGRFVLYADRPGAFAEADVRLAAAMASQVAAAVERRRAEGELRESRNQLQAIVESVADGITVQDARGRLVFANDAAAQLSGFDTAEEMLGTPPAGILERFELLAEDGETPLSWDELPGRQALATGEEAEGVVCYRLRGSGERRWSVVRATPVAGVDGAAALAINVFHEITEARLSEDRLRLLAEAGRALSSSLAVEETLAELARLVVPTLADYCLVDLLEPDGSLRQVVHVHVDPEGDETLTELRSRYPVLGNPSHPVARVIATKEPLLVSDRAEGALDGIALDPAHRRLYRSLSPRSFLAVPLVARGRTLGAISLGTSVSARRLGEDELTLAQELAERAALAVDNALLYEEAQAEVAERERTEERLRALGAASEVLGASLDYETTLRTVARLVVPGMADWCIVYERQPDGGIRRLAVEHAGGQADRVRDVLDRHPLDPEADSGVPAVIRTGEPELTLDESAETLTGDVADPTGLASELEDIAPCSSIRVPLIARGRTLGAIALLAAESGRRYGEDDLAFAVELARRAAIAIDNSLLYREALESRARLDTFLDTAPVGLGFWDRDLRYLLVNEALAAINGLPADEHRGRLLEDVVPDLAPVLRPLWNRILETREPALRFEIEGETPAEPGVHRHWLADYYPVVTDDGEVLGVGAVVTEVTERKRLDAEREELVRELEAQRNMLQAVLTQMPGGVIIGEADTGRIVLANRQADEIWGGTAPLAGAALRAFHPDGRPYEPEEWPLARALAHGEVISGEQVEFERPDGGRGTMEVSAAPVRDAAGEVVAGVVTFDDVTSRALAEEQLRFLVEASTVLASSLEVDATLDSVARLAVPRIADWCSIVLRDDDGSLRNVAVAHKDPAKVEWARELQRRLPTDPDDPRGAAAVIRTGEPELLPEIPDELLVEALADQPDLLEPIRQLGLRSSLAVPLVARGRTLGALTLVTSHESGRTLGADDLALALEVARRAAIAVDNARLFHALEDQSRLTATITATAAAALFMMDGRGRTTYMNPAASAMTGWTLEEIEGRRLHDVFHHSRPDGSPYPFEECPISQTLLHGGEIRGLEDYHFRKDGSMFPIRVSATPIVQDGVVQSALLEMVDITEEKRARAEADARAEAARALEFVGDGVFLVDRGGSVRLWNRAASRITGLRVEDVVGRPVGEALPGWPLEGLEERPATRPVDVGDRELWLSVSAVAFAEGTVYAFRDLTEEYALERLKSDFVSTVSHELRTPLAAIYGAAMTLQRTDVSLADDQRTGLLGVVAGESERLARIVNDVLWASRLDSGVLEVSIESCDAGALAAAVVSAARAHLPSDIELALRVAPDVPPVAADPDKVRQVLVNLVDNAIKYSPDGGLVEVRVEPAERTVRFEVHDRGLGIPATEHERIFEKFFRLDPNLTRGVGGTGLGLYICRELVRRMHGRIGVASEEGLGSTFTFELPVA